MQTQQEKLAILADAAKYDVSCSSSGSRRANIGGLGNAHPAGICHSWSADGRCISLLKILMTNHCIYDCAYCVNRVSNDVPRALLSPDEVVALTLNFYRRNYIEGLFLSSGVYRSPDETMERLVKIAAKLRHEGHFHGYIHMKVIPGASPHLLNQLGLLVDRLSVNLELPSEESLRLLAPQKTKQNILRPMQVVRAGIQEHQEHALALSGQATFVPAGQTTQVIIGATPDSDLRIMRLAQGLYKHVSLKRVYYSAYLPTTVDGHLPALSAPPLLREHRLYQADWLLRFYGFQAEELLAEEQPFFDLTLDPKSQWALNHLDFFPLEVNRADYHALLRVPGIGVKSALRICQARRHRHLSHDNLKAMGVVMKRAKYFITCSERFQGLSTFDGVILYQTLRSQHADPGRQLALFSGGV